MIGNTPLDFDESIHCKIPLKNKKKEIIDYSYVDKFEYEQLKSISWCKDTNGYAVGYFRLRNVDKHVIMHRYLLDAQPGEIIDHKNNNRTDNRRLNLKISTRSQNAQNSKRISEKESKYIGVSFDKNNKLRPWRSICKGIWLGCFSLEEWAGFAYDECALIIFGADAKINNITKPPNYKRFKRDEPNFVMINGEPMRGFTIVGSTEEPLYRIGIHVNGKRFQKVYKDLELAKQDYFEHKDNDELEKDAEKLILQQNIRRNEEGIAILSCTDRKSKPKVDVKVDDDVYRKYVGNHIFLFKSTYPQVVLDGKQYLLHRLVLNAKPNQIVDHIDRDTLNAMECNLRIVPPSVNAHNVTKQNNTSSKFVGVHKQKNSFEVSITKDGVKYYGGRYKSEELAAWARDKLAIDLYGEFASLNNIKIDGYEWENSRAVLLNAAKKYQGVVKQGNKFKAQVWFQGKIYNAGKYETEIVALWAYDQLSRQLKGSDGFQNGVTLTGYQFVNNRAIPILEKNIDAIYNLDNVLLQKRKNNEINESEHNKKYKSNSDDYYNDIYKWFNINLSAKCLL
jgi:hypothetical protein